MISSFLLLLAASAQDESPRLRTVLPNGAIILAERMPEAPTVSAQLFASSKRVPETVETHGRRHLLEHVLAKGPKKNLDARLEGSGAFLDAFTHRDAMQFSITCGPARLDLALESIKDVLKPLETTPEELARETKIIEEELGLLSGPVRLSSAAWRGAYADEGLDPLGTLEVIGQATVADLQALQKSHFAPDGLVLVITGPVNLNEATARGKKVLEGLKPLAPAEMKRRGDGKSDRVEARGGFGEARAARVGSFKNVKTVATLAAALAIAAQFDAPFVTYTPTVQNGLIIVGRTDENSGLGLMIDALQAHQEAELFVQGKMLAQFWVERQLSTAAGVASIRGLLLVQGEANRPETMLEALNQMTFKDFQEGIKRFRMGEAVVSVGVKG